MEQPGRPQPGSAAPGAAGTQATPYGARSERRPLAEESRTTRVLILVGLIPMMAYLGFRLTTLFDEASFLPLNVLLLVGEAMAIAAQVALLFDGWRLQPYEPPEGTARPSIDLLIPIYSEPMEVVRPTLAGCLDQDYDGPTTVWLLDDGKRPAMEQLAAKLGVNYLTRPDNRGAKAGNINHALSRIDGELVAVLDCDMVPQPDFLSSLAPYFEDDDVALVQTPHGFYNVDSFQHYSETRHDQSLFYDVLQWGKDRHNSAYWCGTGGVLRTAAVRDVGGVAESTITEDFHTSVRLHAAGWHSRYHPIALTFGLGPTDQQTYVGQRDRWATGNVSLLRTKDSPLTIRGLTLRQRLSYLATLVAGLVGLRRICFVTAVALILATGKLPFQADPRALVVFLAASLLGGLLSVLALARGRMSPGDHSRGEILALPAQLSALTTLILGDRRRLSFKVTAKNSVTEHWSDFVRGNQALLALTAVLVVGTIVGAIRQVGGIGLPWAAAILTFALAGWEATQLGLAWRFGLRYHQRRKSYRVSTRGRRALIEHDDQSLIGHLIDLSPTGAALEIFDDLEAGQGDTICFSVDGMPKSIPSVIRRVSDRKLGLEFTNVPPLSGVIIDRICYVENIHGSSPNLAEPDGVDPELSPSDAPDHDPKVGPEAEPGGRRRSRRAKRSPADGPLSS